MLINRNRQSILIGLVIGSLGSFCANADVQPLGDDDLASVDARGIDIALEDFIYDASSATVTITDIGGTDKIEVKELYIKGAGSNQGANDVSANIGSLDNPISLDIEQLGPYQALALRFPESALPSSSADIGVKYQFTVTGGRVDTLDVDATGFDMDDSSLRLWGDGNETVGDARIKVSADTLDINTCDNTANCPDQATRADHTVYITGIRADLNLGYSDVQPVNFSVTPDGQFQISAPAVGEGINKAVNDNRYNLDTSAADYRQQTIDRYYQELPKSSITIDNLMAGGSRPSSGALPVGGVNLGSSSLEGIRIQYLQMTSHDLP